MTVGLLVVSHSERAAEGIVEVAAEMSGDVPLGAVGGDPEGGVGTSAPAITDALADLDAEEIVVLVDLGSAVMNAEVAIESYDGSATIADAPVLEGAVNAAVTAAGSKSDVDDVVAAAEEARGISKL